MAFPMMPTAQWDIVRKMGPLELNKAAMGEYQAQGISPVFALARIKEETALAAAFQAQEQKRQQEEQAKMQGVPVEDIPLTVAEGMLRERGITGVDSSAGREMPPEQMAALQGGIAGGAMEEQPMAIEEQPMAMEGPPPMMAHGGLIPGYHGGHLVDEPDHGSGPGEHLAEEMPYEEMYGREAGGARERLEEGREEQHQRDELNEWLALGRERPSLADYQTMSEADRSGIVPAWESPESEEARQAFSDSMIPKVSSQDVIAFADREGISPEEALDLFYPGGFLPTTGREPAGLREAVLAGGQQVPPTTQDVMDVSRVRGGIEPPQVPDSTDTRVVESDADIISRKILGGTEQDVIPEDIEYSRYSDIDPGPSPSSIYNAMSQKSAEISDIQQAYGPDKQRLDRLRLGQLQGGYTDLLREQAAEDLAEEARRGDITGIQALLTDRGRDAKSAINRTRGTQAAARRDAQTQQASIEATRAMTQGQLEDHAFKRDATGASQLEEYQKATNRRADAALFTLAGDELRKPGRDQSFGHIASEVGGIRGDALTATQKIQTYLLDEERKDIDKLFASETLANTETRESQTYLLDKQVSSDNEITRIAHELLDDRATSEEKVRGIEKALRDGDIAQLRLLIAEERGIRDFPITLAEEGISREVDPLIADITRMVPLTQSALSMFGSRDLGATAAQSTAQFENLMGQIGSPEEAQKLWRLQKERIRIEWNQKRDKQGTRLSQDQEVAYKAEIAAADAAYEVSLNAIQEKWKAMALLLPEGHPLLQRMTIRTTGPSGPPSE